VGERPLRRQQRRDLQAAFARNLRSQHGQARRIVHRQVLGPNLTADTYFDIRFRRPGSSIDEVAYDWQQGTSGLHSAASDMASGTWTVTGVRAHQSLADDSGDFFPLSVTLTVSPF
jgi:hypothetical protein